MTALLFPIQSRQTCNTGWKYRLITTKVRDQNLVFLGCFKTHPGRITHFSTKNPDIGYKPAPWWFPFKKEKNKRISWSDRNVL